jgi:alkylhydroperoxidase/carboxymuconolactone decarboxylase family protein YurZ
MYYQEVRDATRRFVDEAAVSFGITDAEVIVAMKQAAFRAVGYTEAAVLHAAELRMDKEKARELRRIVYPERD